MRDKQAHINDLLEIKLAVLSVRERLDSPDPEDVKAAMKEYAELVDSFYEIEENLAPPQYSGAKKDFEYLLRLLDLAILYHLPSDCQEH